MATKVFTAAPVVADFNVSGNKRRCVFRFHSRLSQNDAAQLSRTGREMNLQLHPL